MDPLPEPTRPRRQAVCVMLGCGLAALANTVVGCQGQYAAFAATPVYQASDTDGRTVEAKDAGVSVVLGASAGFWPIGLEYTYVPVQTGPLDVRAAKHSLWLRADIAMGSYRRIEPYWSPALGLLFIDHESQGSSWGLGVGVRSGVLLRLAPRDSRDALETQTFLELRANCVLGSDGDGLGGAADWTLALGLRLGPSLNIYP